MIKDLALEWDMELVHVNQGYARCSVIPVRDKALITCDPGIAKAAIGLGLDVKLIYSGNLLLLGQKYGFIGGSSGITPDGAVVFLGDISEHPDCEGMISFLTKYDVGYVHLKGLPLLDAGSLIFFG